MLLGSDEAPGGVLGIEAREPGRLLLLGDGAERVGILIADRVLSDLLDDLVVETPVVAAESAEADHSSGRPHLVGSGLAPLALSSPVGRHQIHLVGDLGIAEERENGAIAGLFLLRDEPLVS